MNAAPSLETEEPSHYSQGARQKWLLFTGLALAMFVFSLNQAMLSVALPTIVGELGGADQIHWVATSYMLAATSMLPVYGKLGDRFGAHRLFNVASGIFLGACVAGFLITSMEWLIVVRFIQGLGGAGLVVLSQTLLALHIQPKERGKYMGLLGAVFVLSTVLGPVIGGVITHAWGWRWCFGVNIPLGLLSLALCMVFLRTPAEESAPDNGQLSGIGEVASEPHGARATLAGEKATPKIDIAGLVLLTVSITAAVLVMSWGGRTYPWLSLPILGISAAGLVALGLFIAVEARAEDPVLPLGLFSQRNFVVASVISAVLSMAMFAVTTYLPTYIQIVEGVDAAMAGFVLLPMMIAVFLCSTGAGFIISRTQSYRAVLMVGGVLVTASMVLLGLKTVEQPLWYLVLVLVLMGIGLGFSVQMSVLLAQNSSPDSLLGTVTAATNLFRELGGTIGISLAGGLFTARLVNSSAKDFSEIDIESVSPESVKGMSEPMKALVEGIYNDALLPVYLFLSPVVALAIFFIFFINTKQIRN